MAKILIAEDEYHIRKLLVDILAAAGHDIVEAENGGIALEQAWSEHPDLILLDVMMPVMDGFGVLQGLRENFFTEDTPVILVTAVNPEDAEQQGMDLGVQHFIAKPLVPDMVEAAVRSALRGIDTTDAHVRLGNSMLDEKLGGGIPLGSLTLIEGASSAGKSVLCQHLIHGALEMGQRVACFTSEDSQRSLISQMASIGMPVSSYIWTDNLTVFPIEGPKPGDIGGNLLNDLSLKMNSLPKETKLLAVDSITSLASISDEREVATFFAQCKQLCAEKKTIVLVVHSFALDEKMLIRLRSLCDAHLKLTVETMGDRQFRVMEVCKIRNANQNTGNVVTFEVEAGFGIKIVPYSKAKA